jgi:hypothetical protein
MQIKKSVLIATIATSITLDCFQSSPTLSQSPSSRFYCGFTDQKEPATMLVTRNEREEKNFIVWRKFFNNMSPKERCKSVSRIFQKAWSQGNLNYFIIGEPIKGKNFVCGARSKESSCKAEAILFNVENKNQAQNIASRLELIRQGKEKSPIEQ